MNNENNNEILLSICIPTYNRGDLLKKTLETIVSNEIFLNTKNLEVVISDNCSSDNTQEICQGFVEQFPNKVIYHKTKENIGGDNNFHRVLSLGHGKLLKLHNDKCLFAPDALQEIIGKIKEDYNEEYILLLPNKLKANATKEPEFICHNLNEFVEKVYYQSTWIGAFCIWKNDFDKFEDFTRYIHLQLAQSDVLYRQIAEGKPVKVLNKQLFNLLKTNDSGGYNPALVFGKNYLFLLDEYVQNSFLDKKVYEKEKKNVFLNLIVPSYFDYKNRYTFHQNGFFKYLFPIYKNDFYFYPEPIFAIIKKGLYTLLSPFKGVYNFIWPNLNILFYSILKKEEKVQKYKEYLALQKH